MIDLLPTKVYLFPLNTSHYTKMGYNRDIMRRAACLVFNPLMVNIVCLFNSTTVDQIYDGAHLA